MKDSEEGFDAEKLLLEITSGKSLSKDDEELVGRLLEAPDDRLLGRHLSQDDIYSLVMLVGRAKLKKFRHLIAAFMDRDDPLTVSLVLEVLCLDWQETSEFLERVISFALGLPWDEDGDVRQTAIKILGEYLHAALASVVRAGKNAAPAEQHVLSLLLHLFEDDEDEWIRFAAYRALLHAGGVPTEEIPNDGYLPDLSPESSTLDRATLEKLRRVAGYSSDSFSGSPGSIKGPASMR